MKCGTDVIVPIFGLFRRSFIPHNLLVNIRRWVFYGFFLLLFFCHVKRVARTLYLSLLSWYTQAPFLCYVIFQFNPRFTRMTCASFQSYDMAGH